MKRFKGSISVFIALILLSLLGIFTSIIEFSRINTAKTEVEIGTYGANRSLAGYYSSELWEKYDLLCVDFSKFNENVIKDYLNYSLQEKNGILGSNLIKANIKNIDLVAKYLVQEGGYEVFRQAVTSSKYRLPKHLVDRIKGGDNKEKLVSEKNFIEEYKNNDNKKSWDKKYNKKTHIKDPREDKEKFNEELNDYLNKFDSNKKIKKVKLNGRFPETKYFDALLFNEYILSHFSSAVNEKDDENINYELEYIISGSTNEKDCLDDVCFKIKLIRIPFNLAFLIKNKEYNIMAETTALLLMGWTLNPAIVKATKYGILGVWAYAESVKDIKKLLSGGKVPLIKTEKDWSLGISGIENTISDNVKKDDNGLDYEGYIRMLLSTISSKKKTARIIDLMSSRLKNSNIYDMAYEFKTSVDYSISKTFFNPIFFNNKIYNQKFIAGYRYR